jgi:glycosyltransferase involved in cell wall biosynthesis
MKVSIIVPVYNVEKYIKDCVMSVFRQGLCEEDFEIIFINDGTEDNSLGVIEEICILHKNVKIVNQNNQGLSCARNTGLLYAKGDYVMFLDSDDLLADRSVAPLLELAFASNVDLLVADFMKLSDDEILKYKGEINDILCSNQKSGPQLYMDDFNPNESYVWRTIYKRDFLMQNELRFIPGVYFEDIPFTPECYLKARVCLRVNFVLYLYRIGNSSITSNMDKKKAMDINVAIERLWKLKAMKGLSKRVRRRLSDNIFSNFSFALWCISHNDNVYVSKDEIVQDLKNRVPDIWFNNSIKQFLVSVAFRFFPEMYLKIRSFL